MSKQLFQELKKCAIADVSNIKGDEMEIYIDKLTKLVLQVNKYYLIEIADSMLTQNSASLLMTNWNGGTIPKHKYMRIEVLKLMSNMVKIMGVGYDIQTGQNIKESWEGWLPSDSIKILEKVE